MFEKERSEPKPGASRATPLLLPGLERIYAPGRIVSHVLLRIAFGLTIATHGLPKLTGSAHGSMADPFGGSVNLIGGVLGLPFATQLATFVALLETVGGLTIAMGLATRLFAPMLGVQMLVICLALGPTYPWIDRGIEYPIVLGFIALHLSMHGAGAWSLDRSIGREL